MLSVIVLLVVSLTASSFAAPMRGVLNDAYNYSEDLAQYFSRVSRHIDAANGNRKPICDASNISLPSSTLPIPTNLKIRYVAVGRGTQNYTCTSSSPDIAPVAAGAIANLYDATCIAANYPDLMPTLPKVAYSVPLPGDELSPLPPANMGLIGHHFFRDATTPVFNLDTTSSRQYGIAITKKIGSFGAPSNSLQGANGAVPWLYLTTINGTMGDYRSVYRVETAGGQPPKTCENLPSNFTVQYAANYYFYGK